VSSNIFLQHPQMVLNRHHSTLSPIHPPRIRVHARRVHLRPVQLVFQRGRVQEGNHPCQSHQIRDRSHLQRSRRSDTTGRVTPHANEMICAAARSQNPATKRPPTGTTRTGFRYRYDGLRRNSNVLFRRGHLQAMLGLHWRRCQSSGPSIER
jgi:hypothetical protein